MGRGRLRGRDGDVSLVLDQEAGGDAALLEGRVLHAPLQELEVVGQPANLVLLQRHAHAPKRLGTRRSPAPHHGHRHWSASCVAVQSVIAFVGQGLTM